ncbi:hypothetical protein ACFE04_011855 [Oxalis oulophora]
MALVIERRQQQALKLSLPTLATSSLCRQTYLPPSFPTSPEVSSLSDLENISVLGHGSGGTVYKVKHKKSDSIYALKLIHSDRNPVSKLQAAHEVEILDLVDSKFIVKCYAVFQTMGGELCFVMEYMGRGSLQDLLHVNKILPESVISEMVARKALEGLHYLQGLQIVHGDIKPSNLLINIEGDLKIADFGVSRIVIGATCNNNASNMGTCAYMSPERVDPERWDGVNADGFAGDIWSLGVVVLECFVGYYPLIGIGEKLDWAALLWGICFGETLENMLENGSSEFKSFVRKCLEKDWRKRGTVDELLNHPFVSK